MSPLVSGTRLLKSHPLNSPLTFVSSKTTRRHRERAQGFTLPQRPVARLAEDENPACEAVRREEQDWGR